MQQTISTRIQAQSIQSQRQQGLGKPIISIKAFGRRFVAVKNCVLQSQNWHTFHDFLGFYIKMAMGFDWGKAELAKTLEQRHPILLWYDLICEHQQHILSLKEQDNVHLLPMTGAVAAFIRLAYDLYTLDHNAELQKKLIGRLRNTEGFAGAYYEASVIASFIRAGFEIEYEDDRNTTHCEIIATFPMTGKRFSVEAKHKAGRKCGLGKQLNKALRKKADYTRVVFIGINIPDEGNKEDAQEWINNASKNLKYSFEGQNKDGKTLPEAYVFITNTPCHHHLQTDTYRFSVKADGFNIPDFNEAHESHIEMHELLSSIIYHSSIPSTFDGDIPEFAFGEDVNRLLIGEHYRIKDENGRERLGQLINASVVEPEGIAKCTLLFEDGKERIHSWTFSDEEMAIWRKYPDTFFIDVGNKESSLSELYELHLKTYSQTPRARLLELLVGVSDIDDLSNLDQSALVRVYAERCVTAHMVKFTNKSVRF